MGRVNYLNKGVGITNMLIKKGQLSILIFNLIVFPIFMLIYYLNNNLEFLLYSFVILGFFALILLTNNKVNYPNPLLWGLTIWCFIHLAGGAIKVGSGVLYGVILLPLVGDPYYIFKYDQFAHTFGFAVATLAMYYLLKPYLKEKFSKSRVSLGIVVVMAGIGVGAINEILEFMATVIIPNTGVGGYINTSLDLVFNLVGALIAWGIIYFKKL